MTKKLFFMDKVYLLFLTCLVFSFFIDSGDPLGIRRLSLLVVALIFVKYARDFVWVDFDRLVSWSYMLICVLALYSIIWACINGVEFISTLPWIVPLLLFPVFCYVFMQFKPFIVRLAFICAGLVFSICVFVVFVCIFLYGDVVKAFFYNLNFPGWFYLRGDGYPQVYFQSTLAFVVLSLYSFLIGYKKCSAIFLLSLLVSLSRFGVFVVVLFVILNYILGSRRLAGYSFILMVFLSFAAIPIMLLLYLVLPANVDYQGTSETVRFGHVVSVFSSMSPIDYVLGMGPGSSFYSRGFNAFADNIEVSQLELFRKYGFIGYTLFHLSFFCLSWNFLVKKDYPAQICFAAFYFVSFSNPVLATFLFSIFVSVFLSGRNKHTEPDEV